MAFRKILVTGNAGSGKTTLSKRLADHHGLPWHTLDQIVWKAGWKKTPPDEKKLKISQLTRQGSWVIDGVSTQVQETADLVVFLDFPRRTCFWRVVKRNPKYLFKSRPELPPNCPEIRIVPKLLKIIWQFPNSMRPKILAEKESSRSFVHIQSQRDLDSFLANS